MATPGKPEIFAIIGVFVAILTGAVLAQPLIDQAIEVESFEFTEETTADFNDAQTSINLSLEGDNISLSGTNTTGQFVSNEDDATEEVAFDELTVFTRIDDTDPQHQQINATVTTGSGSTVTAELSDGENTVDISGLSDDDSVDVTFDFLNNDTSTNPDHPHVGNFTVDGTKQGMSGTFREIMPAFYLLGLMLIAAGFIFVVMRRM